MKNQLTNKSGFTLIEILISLLMLSITLVAGIQLYINADKILTLATHKRMATEEVNNKLEELKTWDYNDLDLVNLPDSTQTIGGFRFTKSYAISELDGDGDGINDYKELSANLFWQEPVNANNYQITFRTNYSNE